METRYKNKRRAVEVERQPSGQITQAVDEEHEPNSVPSQPKRRRVVVTRDKPKTGGEGLTFMYRFMRRTVGDLSSQIKSLEKEIRETKGSHENDGRMLQIPEIELQPEPESVSSNEERLNLEKELNIKEAKRVVYNIRTSNQDKPKYGDQWSLHPVNFLEDLESYLKKEENEGKELDIIKGCLHGDARDWARIYGQRWKDYDDFKIDFLATYWGESEQNELRRSITQGSWNATRKQEKGRQTKLTEFDHQCDVNRTKLSRKYYRVARINVGAAGSSQRNDLNLYN